MIAALAAHPAVLAAVRVLADDDDGGESKKSGPIGLAVILALCVACYFLFKSMSRHLRNVREKAAAEMAAAEARIREAIEAEPEVDPDAPMAELEVREPEKAPPQ